MVILSQDCIRIAIERCCSLKVWVKISIKVGLNLALMKTINRDDFFAIIGYYKVEF